MKKRSWDKFLAKVDEYIDTFKKISEIRNKALDLTRETYSQMVENSEKENMPDFIWRDIGIKLYLLNQFDKAADAMERAVIEGEKLTGNERKVLSAIYGDLAMIYEHMDKYEDAVDAHRKGLETKIKFYGEEDESVMRAKKRLERAEKIAKV